VNEYGFKNFFQFSQLETYLDCGRSIYYELLKEKELLQELNYICHYARAVNGNNFFLKKLNETRSFLINIDNKTLFKKYNMCAFFLYKPIYDLREGHKQLKDICNFLVKSGVISSEFQTYLYLININKFCNISILGKLFLRKECLTAEEILDIINYLDNFIKNIEKVVYALSQKYIFKIEQIKQLKKYSN